MSWLIAHSWLLTNVIAAFLLPPLSLLLLMGIGVYLFYRRPQFARFLLVSIFILLWLASTPYVAGMAVSKLEARTKPLDWPTQAADAIVILGGGSYFHAPEYDGQDTVGEATLLRLRYGAYLHHQTGKPILVTGGKPMGNAVPEATQMRVALQRDFQTPVRWAEGASDNTVQNARYSFVQLHAAGITRIYLVTHAWHMPRAARAFRQAGFEVIEAPTAFHTRYTTSLLTFLPSADALETSKIAVHEAIGLLWYTRK